MDDEHNQLFDHLREIGHTTESTQHLSDLKFKMRAFDYERAFFCNSETYHDCEEHSKKHDVFYKRLAMENPVPIEEVDRAKNWPYVWQPYLEV